jgi:hypothetical protein
VRGACFKNAAASQPRGSLQRIARFGAARRWRPRLHAEGSSHHAESLLPPRARVARRGWLLGGRDRGGEHGVDVDGQEFVFRLRPVAEEELRSGGGESEQIVGGRPLGGEGPANCRKA